MTRILFHLTARLLPIVSLLVAWTKDVPILRVT